MKVNDASTLQEVEKAAVSQPFNSYVKQLLQFGILYYEVDVTTGSKTLVATNANSITISGETPINVCATEFKEEEVAIAVQRMRESQITYAEFLTLLAAAGVHSYVADLESLTITYRSADTYQRYNEEIYL